MDGKIIMDNYQALDRVLKQERMYILDLCKRIKKEGCNVLLIQKSILRDAVNDMALQYLAKLGIMVVKEIERDDVEFISRVCILSFFFAFFSYFFGLSFCFDG